MSIRNALAIGFTAAAVTAGTVLLAAPAQASAQACSGSGCDGRDPSQYCQSDARTVQSVRVAPPSQPQAGALLELRYSPSCRAAWARLSQAGWTRNDNAQPRARIVRNSDGRTYTCYVPLGGTSCYTLMVNDANVTSYAWGYYDAGAWDAETRTGSY